MITLLHSTVIKLKELITPGPVLPLANGDYNPDFTYWNRLRDGKQPNLLSCFHSAHEESRAVMKNTRI